MKEFKNFVEEVNSANHFSVKYEISRILYSKQSPFQKVEVAETLGHGKMLLNDDLVMITERDEFIYHDMISHVPLFTHPNPERVLVIGGGDGGTAREVLRHKSVQLCEMVEIDALVVEACREFIPQTAVGMREDSRFKLHIADGVEFIKDSDPGLYDVIIVDSTDPIGPAQPLFGSEFYQGIFRALKDDGLVVSQGESPYYNPDVQQMMAKMLSGIFPILRYYNFTNLTYPGGYWSFSFASKKYDPIKDFKPNRVDESQLKFGYYNKDIHLGAFRLPSFQLENIGSFLK